MTVTDKDREAYTAADSHEATALLSALRNMHCDSPHPIFGPPCERCLSTVHDALASAIGVIRRQAIAAARAEERKACVAAIRKECPRAHTYASENADLYRAQDHMVDMAIAAIRARGED